MSLIFVQTDTTLTAEYGKCVSAANGDAIATVKRNAVVGGTAGSAEATATINKQDTQDAVFFACSGIGDSSWRGGAGESIDFNLNINSAGELNQVRVSASRITSAVISQ